LRETLFWFSVSGAPVTAESFEYLAQRWSETPRFAPLWVAPAVVLALLGSSRFCLIASLTNSLERSAVRDERVPVFTDGLRTIVDRHVCAVFAAELQRAEKRFGMVRP
jgi:hypothetical protein